LRFQVGHVKQGQLGAILRQAEESGYLVFQVSDEGRAEAVDNLCEMCARKTPISRVARVKVAFVGFEAREEGICGKCELKSSSPHMAMRIVLFQYWGTVYLRCCSTFASMIAFSPVLFSISGNRVFLHLAVRSLESACTCLRDHDYHDL
jgi:hypothetical protein